tara:strand:+ start:288 stop:692 length:405 start_codon:yes stop_codon:yes gene_type:complete
MARVTVQDCIKKVPNRFDLVVAAAQRSREISNGMPIEIERDNDKNPVVSLREIAEDAIDPSTLQERFIRSMQKNILRTETVDDEVPSIDDEFSAYLKNAEDINPNNKDLLSNNIKTDEENSFDDISIDLLKSED